MTLVVRNLSYRLHHATLIEKISATFQPGFLYGILGPNGSGKSTFLKTLSAIWTPTEGEIFWKEQDLRRFSRRELSRALTLVPQNPPLFFDFDVYHMVAMGCYAKGASSKECSKQVEDSLRQVDGWHLRDRMICQLSGGERQRIYIARALATGAPILLLDEPTSYLDLRHQLEVWELLKKLVKQGKLVIVAVHDIVSAKRFCDQLVILQKGRCQAIGTYENVMTPQMLEDVFGVTLDETLGFTLDQRSCAV